MNKFYLQNICCCLSSLILICGCTKEATKKEDIFASRGIAAVVNNNFDLLFFSAALQATGNSSQLVEAGPFTLLAPSNTAFNAFGYSSAIDIKKNGNSLQKIVPYHIYKGLLKLDSIPYAYNQSVNMESDLPIYVSHSKNARDTAITVNGSRVESVRFEASNGYIYVLNKVLTPTVFSLTTSQIGNMSNLTFFRAAIQNSGLESELNNNNEVTIFAPVNAAFNAAGIKSIDSIYRMSPFTLKQLVLAHVTKGRRYVYDYIMKADITSNSYSETMLDNKVVSMLLIKDPIRSNRFIGVSVRRIDENGVIVNANILNADISAKNGVIHPIDKILTP